VVAISDGQDMDSGKNKKRNDELYNRRVRTTMIFSIPERNRSLWNLLAECSSSGGNLSSAARVPRALMSLKCEVYAWINFPLFMTCMNPTY
jgi:hypothetical protein